MSPLVGAAVAVGQHWVVKPGGVTIFLDTVISTVVAFCLVLAAGFYLRFRVTSGVPSRFQALVETVWVTVDDYVQRMLGKSARWVVPLCTTLFFYILISNWLELIPTGGRLTSPTADVNDTGALAILVIVLVHVTSIRQRGFRGYIRINYFHPEGLALPIRILLFPINVIAQISYPVSLALRLFGNMFAAALMLEIIAVMPVYIFWFFNGVWKLFEGLFVDVIQAFIFALLTVIYLNMATAEEGHQTEDEAALEFATSEPA